MVIVEILAPIYDEESGQIEWQGRALVMADSSELKIYGDGDLLGGGTMTVIEPTTRRKIDKADDPEAWARNLPHAFRGGDLVAVIRDGDETDLPVENEPPQDLPIVPAPPAPAPHTSVRECV